jgi:hypothetical protein
MPFWTNWGKLKSDKRGEEGVLLQRCVAAWGSQVVHVWDRGFASAPWMGGAQEQEVRFILRWPSLARCGLG